MPGKGATDCCARSIPDTGCFPCGHVRWRSHGRYSAGDRSTRFTAVRLQLDRMTAACHLVSVGTLNSGQSRRTLAHRKQSFKVPVNIAS